MNPRPKTKSRPFAFLYFSSFASVSALALLACPAACQTTTGTIVRGTLQIKRGPTLMETLLGGQMFMTMGSQLPNGGLDACDFDLYIGTPYGNRRVIQRFLTGNGAPGSSGMGAILDMYFDKVNLTLYQKTSAGWGSAISLTPNFAIGTVSTLAAGASATVSITGTGASPVFNLGIPTGAMGQAGTNGANGTNGITPTISIGTVSTLAAGSSATATLTGTATAKTLNLGLPAGATGLTGATGAASTGAQGIQGLTGATGATGATPNLTIGTVTPNFTSATPSATINGTATNPVLNLSLPASPYTFMADIPVIALAEINTNKAVTLTFPTAFPGTNYIYYVQFISTSGGLINTLSWTQGSKTASALTLNVKSTIAVLSGTAQAWVMVSYKNAP